MRRRDASILVVAIVLASLFAYTVTVLPDNARASILYVGGSGPGNFTTIQEAINASNPGDTVFVYAGTYYEHLSVNKMLSLVGEDRDSTVIDANYSGEVVVAINSDWVNVSGFTVTKAYYDGGVYLDSVQHCNISDIRSTWNYDGISMYGSDNNTIVNNIAHDNLRAGIGLLDSHNNTVIYNDASSNNNGSLLLQDSNNNIISGNNASSNEWGMQLHGSRNNYVANNSVYYNMFQGLGLHQSPGNTIYNNHASSNGWEGLTIAESDLNRISNNTLAFNDEYGIQLRYSRINTLTDNVMIGNGIDVWTRQIEHSNTHDIDTSNTVNGNPVLYFKNATGGVVPPNAGQVILANCTDMVIENQSFSDGSGGIHVFYSHQIRISNNTLDNNGGSIFVEGSYSNTVLNNSVTNDSGSISLSGSNNLVFGNMISNSKGIGLGDSDYNRILNNTIISSSYTGIYLSDSDRNTFANNSISSSARWNIRIDWQSMMNVFDSNEISDSEYGLYFDSTGQSTISNNTITDCGIGIVSSYTDNLTITGNTFARSGVRLSGNLEHWTMHTIDASNTVNGKPLVYWKNVAGGVVPSGAGQVIIANSSNITVDNQDLSNASVGLLIGHSSAITVNNITANDGIYGIESYQSSQGTFTNVVAANNRRGIYLDESDTHLISDSVVSHNLRGIYLSGLDSRNCTIINNTVLENTEYGISLFHGWYCRVYHNNLIDNGQQAHSPRSAHNPQWDDGYPSGGNYWSDYAGVDFKSGPLQDQPGSDGIGDTPVIIDQEVRDRYPLMSPYNIYLLRAPTIQRTDLVGLNLEIVLIEWLLSPDDGLGSDSVVRYDIYRGAQYDANGSGYSFLSSVNRGVSTFIDSTAGEGDPNDYFYMVCAADSGNNSSCAKNQASKFTRNLQGGLNLVSLPLAQSNESTEVVFRTLEWDVIWTYNRSYKRWISYNKWKSVKELTDIPLTHGFWINVTENSNFTVAGIVPIRTEIHLRHGWNLVGFPSFDRNYTVGDFKAETGVTRVEGFDPAAPPYFLRAMGDGEFLETGCGYWAYLESIAVWIVTNP